MATDIDTQVQERIESFASELADLLKQAVAQAVADALGETGGRKAGRRGGARAAQRNGAAGPQRKAAPSRRAAAGRRRKGEKRSPEELEALTNALYKEVKRDGGRRIEEISASMGVPTKELVLPARKLIDAKLVRTKGQRRATRYTAA